MTTDINLLVLVGHGSGEASDWDEINALGAVVAQALSIPVQTALLEAVDVSIGERILSGMLEHQPRHVIVLPLFLGASASRHNTIRQIIEAAQDRWPDVGFQYGMPPGLHVGVIAAYQDLLSHVVQAHRETNKTALLVVGRGSRDADSNAEVVQMAHMLGETSSAAFLIVETAFDYAVQPDIDVGITRCVEAGAERVVVLPYLLYDRTLYQSIHQQIQDDQTQYPHLTIIMAPYLSLHPGMIRAIVQRYDEALADLARLEDSPQFRTRTHTHGGQHSHTRAESSIDTLLPPRYQDGASVSAAPMGAAGLIFDAQGQVAWDEIWGNFCDLALAGGPPHRGTLLEPVFPEAVRADPDNYQQVIAELARGIHMITKLPVITQASPGWIGLQCSDENMALWLLRAIIVENVTVRREGDVLYLPAGPHFRLEYEIKNVITVIAKTHHYWVEHLNS